MQHNTALLVMDMQMGILPALQNTAQLIINNAKAIDHARRHNIPVIYVTVGFRQGAPEVSPNNRTFSAAKERFANAEMDEFTRVHPELAPQAGEVQVMKRRVSAFAGSDLEVILRAYGTQHLVLTGIATSGVVLSTLREAADKDFRITVISDCCADGDAEVHDLLMRKVFSKQGDVVTLAEWAGGE